MKLEKREITLNEADSVTDMLYMEKTLLSTYEQGEKVAERKETKSLCAKKTREIRNEIELLQKETKNIRYAT